MTHPRTEVTIQREDTSEVVVAPRGTARATPGPAVAVLEADGALLVWTDLPEALPEAVIHDAGAAQRWLWEVYGDDVALALDELLRTGRQSIVADAVPGALAPAAGRLTWGHWALRWWPESVLDGLPGLSPDLLGMELALWSHDCERLLAEHEDGAATLLAEHGAGLAELVRWRTDPTYGDAAARLDQAVRALAEQQDVLLPTAARPSDRDGFALAAGPRGLRADGGVLENDWTGYPPGLIDAAEQAITWRTDPDGDRWEITALAVPRATPMGLVVGRASHPLRLVDDHWQATVPATGASAGLRISLPGFDPGPETTPDARRQLRDRVRQLARRAMQAPDRPFAVALAADRPDDY